MKLLPCSWRNTDMIIRTFYNHNSLVNRVIYELPRHQEVNEFTKMTLVEKRGNWYVIADVYPQNAKSQVPCEKTRTELYTYEK